MLPYLSCKRRSRSTFIARLWLRAVDSAWPLGKRKLFFATNGRRTFVNAKLVGILTECIISISTTDSSSHTCVRNPLKYLCTLMILVSQLLPVCQSANLAFRIWHKLQVGKPCRAKRIVTLFLHPFNRRLVLTYVNLTSWNDVLMFQRGFKISFELINLVNLMKSWKHPTLTIIWIKFTRALLFLFTLPLFYRWSNIS